jgi:hypothetical protein
MQRLAYYIAEALPALTVFGPAAAIAGMLTASLARIRRAATA